MSGVRLFAASNRSGDLEPSDPFVLGPTELAVGAGAGPLSGLRFAVKDLYDVAGTRTGAGNPVWYEDAPVATCHAGIVDALVQAGATLVGKTVSDELAFSLSGTNVHYGTPVNVAAPGRVPGGSSSGSASAVASGLVDFALGTDTGGSTRVPASYCGIFGLRVTHGLLARDGVFLLAPSFCAPGLFSADGAVLEEVWRVLRSSDAAERPAEPARLPSGILLAPELFGLADTSARRALERAAISLAARWELPIHVESFAPLGSLEELLGAFRTIQLHEAWQLHGPWVRTHRATLGPGIAQRFDAASEVTDEAVELARARRAEFQRRFSDYLGDNLLVQPAASGAAPPIALVGTVKDDLRFRTMMLTAPAGLAGAPVVSLPVARSERLPIGLALVGAPDDDGLLVSLAARVPVERLARNRA